MRMRILAKLVAGFGLLLLLMGVIGYTGWSMNDQLEGALRHVSEQSLPGTVALSNAERGLWELRFGIANFMTADEAGRAKILSDGAKWQSQVEENLKAFAAAELSTEERAALKALQDSLQQYLAARPRWFDLYANGQIKEAAEYRASYTNKYAANTVKAMGELIALQAQQTLSEVTAVEQSSENAGYLIAGLVGTALLLGAAIAIGLARSISGSARTMAAAAGRLAEGDLTVEELRVTSRDELGDLATGFNTMIRNLRAIVREVSLSAEGLAASAIQVNHVADEVTRSARGVGVAVQQMSAGANSQAQSVHEVTRTMGQLRAAVRQIEAGAGRQATGANSTAAAAKQVSAALSEMVERVRQVAGAAQVTARTADDGRQAVRQTLDGMRGIQSAVLESAELIRDLGQLSNQIGTISQTSAEIADQTNLLALNAAIEAARAGEHGRGFAVVADEVRKLAERASRSSGEIGSLIQRIQAGTTRAITSMEEATSEVAKGSSRTSSAGESLEHILTVVEGTARDIESIMVAADQINAASRAVLGAAEEVAVISEQNTAVTRQMADGAATVNSSISGVAAVAEENAAAVEEVSASTEEMVASMEEVARAATALQEVAASLKRQVGAFRV